MALLPRKSEAGVLGVPPVGRRLSIGWILVMTYTFLLRNMEQSSLSKIISEICSFCAVGVTGA